MANGPFAKQRWSELVEEFASVRQATLHLLAALEGEAWRRRGTCWNHTISVHALAWVVAGHTQLHRLLLAERYGL